MSKEEPLFYDICKRENIHLYIKNFQKSASFSINCGFAECRCENKKNRKDTSTERIYHQKLVSFIY